MATAKASEQDVDRFVATRVKPELRDVVAAIRQIMKKEAPKATLCISYGIPAWRGKRILALISPTKRDITFAFARGAEFEESERRASTSRSPTSTRSTGLLCAPTSSRRSYWTRNSRRASRPAPP